MGTCVVGKGSKAKKRQSGRPAKQEKRIPSKGEEKLKQRDAKAKGGRFTKQSNEDGGKKSRRVDDRNVAAKPGVDIPAKGKRTKHPDSGIARGRKRSKSAVDGAPQ